MVLCACFCCGGAAAAAITVFESISPVVKIVYTQTPNKLLFRLLVFCDVIRCVSACVCVCVIDTKANEVAKVLFENALTAI